MFNHDLFTIIRIHYSEGLDDYVELPTIFSAHTEEEAQFLAQRLTTYEAIPGVGNGDEFIYQAI